MGADAPEGVVTGGTISGGSIWNNTVLTKGYTIVTPSGNIESYGIMSDVLAQQPPAGTPFTYTLASVATGTVSYTIPLNAWTTEAIRITNLTGTTLADAHLNSPLTVNWTLPKTFPVAKVMLGANINAGNYQCKTANGDMDLGCTVTSGTITIPSTCHGIPASNVDVNVSVWGVNGEEEWVIYSFISN